jgi:hypothetical protein
LKSELSATVRKAGCDNKYWKETRTETAVINTLLIIFSDLFQMIKVDYFSKYLEI